MRVRPERIENEVLPAGKTGEIPIYEPKLLSAEHVCMMSVRRLNRGIIPLSAAVVRIAVSEPLGRSAEWASLNSNPDSNRSP